MSSFTRHCPACGRPLNNPGPTKLEVPGFILDQRNDQDPEFTNQFERLRRLQRSQITPGSDLRPHWQSWLDHSVLLQMLVNSNIAADSIKGRRDLLAKRRRNILRHLNGTDFGMPIDYPEPTAFPGSSDKKEYRVFRLRDELEWITIAFYLPSREFPYGRPVREILTHDLVRAILDWKASHLDLWLSTYPHLIGGRLYYPIPNRARKAINERAESRGRRISSPREFLPEVRFSTAAFMRWYYANMN